MEDDQSYAMDVPTIDKMERMPEDGFNLEEVKGCILHDCERRPITFREILDSKYATTIFVFLRHFLDYVTRDYVEDFSKIFRHELEKNDCRIVMIGCSPARHIKHFVEQTNCPHAIYCDSSRVIHKILRLHSVSTALPHTRSPHIKTNAFLGFWQTIWRSVTSTEQGDPFQMGGQLIINSDERILFFHRDTHPHDHTPINELLEVVGLPRIDFCTKYRIKDV